MSAAVQDGPPPPDESTVIRPGGDKGVPLQGAGSLGMAIFLASLSMLFGAGFVGYVVIRLRAEQWPPPDMPHSPWIGLLISSLLLAGCSAAIQTALNGIRRGSQQTLRRFLIATALLATGFLVNQSLNWLRLFEAESFRTHLYGFAFFMLTALHGLHVVGGIVSLAAVGFRAFRGDYSWAFYPGVRYCATYWHFLGVVWIPLAVVLLL